jgi:HEAT repeat protein
MDKNSVEALVSELERVSWWGREDAQANLGILGLSAIEPIMTKLQDENEEIRNKFAGALSYISDLKALEVLAELTTHNLASVQIAAAKALANMGDERAIAPLITLLKSDDCQIRTTAMDSLDQLGRPGIKPLLVKLQDKDEKIRQSAATALANMGEIIAVTPLSELLNSSNWQVRESAAISLGGIKYDLAARVLLVALNDTNSKVRLAAVKSLGRIGNKTSVEGLFSILARSLEPTRKTAADELLNINSKHAVNAVINALRHNNPQVQILIIKALERHARSFHGDKPSPNRLLKYYYQEILDILIIFLEEANLDIRQIAFSTLRAVRQQLELIIDLYHKFSFNGSIVPGLHKLLDDAISYEKRAKLALENATSKPSEYRYADITFYYYEDGFEPKVLGSYVLRAKQWYQLEVAIRDQPTGVPIQKQERRPIREPKQQESVTIVITAEGDGFEIKEPIQTLILPPVGDSTKNGYFQVRPLRQSVSDKDLASIRIRAYYKFNLLEVSVIQAEVVGKFDDSSQSKLGLEKPISFRQERLEREYLDFDEVEPKAMHIDISKENERFIFNFAFYNNLDQKVEFTAPIYLPAPDLEDALLTIRQTWYDIAMSKTFAERVEGDDEEFLTNIRRLAKAGRNFWMKLFKIDSDSSMHKVGKWLEDNPLQKGAIIQVSLAENAKDFVFPWALVYDQKVPKKDYELPDPEGFWGLRYCIEQQLPNQNKGTDKPVQIQDKLRVGFMLWEQFRNANTQKALMENWTQCNPDKLEITTPPITDADDCYALLDDCDAHILYFYTHGYTRHRQADIGVEENLQLFTSRYERLKEDDPRRELWKFLYESVKQDKFEPDRSWIELTYGRLYLDELYDDITRKLGSRPLVFLNMCESAQITPSLSDSFIHFFINRGAKGVIGTECPMTVEFAHPFSEKFLGDLLAGETVGNALLNARHYFMKLKNPLGLAYTLFGSATACFQPAILEPLIMPATTSFSTESSSDS